MINQIDKIYKHKNLMNIFNKNPLKIEIQQIILVIPKKIMF